MGTLKKLEDTEISYRPLNYWGWLENIAPEEVKWQIRQMSEVGLGGYVMHARGGLLIPYMGDQWMASVKAMIEQGNELGMTTIIDDEDGWPSGFGAGKVNGKGEEYWLKWLECERINPEQFEATDCTIGVYKIKGNKVELIKDFSKIKYSKDEIIHIYYKSSKYYVDNLDPKVVKEFIDVSYQEYHNKFSGDFGEGVKGVFSDEPQLARDLTTWSFILPQEFIKKYGYDLIEVLPAIYFEIEGYEKIRYDFWNLISSLFTISYSKQIGDWCGEHKVELIGHTCYEDAFDVQMMCSGSTMPFYEYMQVPGIDWLCRIPVNNMVVKQVTSVAQQLGKKRILCEMFGCVGWNVSFEEMKWIGEWNYVLGINMMLQHLGLYSLRGSRKREYPASLFFQQPWWGEFKPFNDYFARLSKIVSECEPVIDLLVIHPMRSAWIFFEGHSRERVQEFNKTFTDLTDHLLHLNFDFHYGDEEIMLRYGKVKGKEFIVGRSSYKAVLIPASLSLDYNTVELLEQFVSNGGKVISMNEFPYLIAGKRDIKIDNLKQKVVQIGDTVPELENALSGEIERKIRVVNCDGSRNEDIYCCTRISGEETIYYIVNTNKEKEHKVNILVNDENSLFKINLIDCSEVLFSNLNQIYLEPTESILLISRKSAKTGHDQLGIKEKVNETVNYVKEKVTVEGEWNVVEAENNALTLDYCNYAIDNGPWEGEIPVILLQEKLLAMSKPVDVAMRFTFNFDFNNNSNLYLVIEEPEKFIIHVNGKQLAYKDEGWWIDKSFRKISIENLVKTGVNEIILMRNFYCSEKVYRIKNDKTVHEAEANRVTVETELENIYLLGDFSVNYEGGSKEIDRNAIFAKKPFAITSPRKKADIKNLESEGYPFFTGKLKLANNFTIKTWDKEKQKAELKLKRPDSIVTRVFINGAEVKTFLWAPYRADVSEFLREGENEIEVELINSCRNLLGPHHNTAGELYTVGQHSFKEFVNWTEDYCLVKFGLSEITINY